jgi:hypothetical protein
MLFVGALYGREEHYLSARLSLEAAFGQVLRETPSTHWEYSDYYAGEFGRPLMRRFLFFRDLIEQGALMDIKLRSIQLEAGMSMAGKRLVNLDPGYLTGSKVVLSSTKDYSHRIYLGRGIYAEITLYFKHGMFRPHVFTYRDYREGENLRLFGEMREVFKGLTGK